MERKEVLLTAKITMEDVGEGDVLPYIRLSDDRGKGIGVMAMGNCIGHSVETMARIYQADNEYRSKEKFSYYVQWEGNKRKNKLFQREVLHDYGEPSTYIDETDKR